MEIIRAATLFLLKLYLKKMITVTVPRADSLPFMNTQEAIAEVSTMQQECFIELIRMSSLIRYFKSPRQISTQTSTRLLKD